MRRGPASFPRPERRTSAASRGPGERRDGGLAARSFEKQLLQEPAHRCRARRALVVRLQGVASTLDVLV